MWNVGVLKHGMKINQDQNKCDGTDKYEERIDINIENQKIKNRASKTVHIFTYADRQQKSQK